MIRTRIYLARHGQVEGHEEKRYNGQRDVPLTALGRQQFAALAERLQGEKIGAVYSSDLSRCLEGARLLARPHALEPVACPDLRELNIGDWEGITWKELKQRYPREWQARLSRHRPLPGPGGRESARCRQPGAPPGAGDRRPAPGGRGGGGRPRRGQPADPARCHRRSPRPALLHRAVLRLPEHHRLLRRRDQRGQAVE